MNKPNIIGVDPGCAGALAFISADHRDISLFPFKGLASQQIAKIFLGVTLDPYAIFLEDVHSMPGQGVKSMFTFGINVGVLKGIMAMGSIPWEDVKPQQWQQAVGVAGAKLEYAKRKRYQLAKAQQLFPNTPVTPDTADALLIAEYGYRQIYRV